MGFAKTILRGCS